CRSLLDNGRMTLEYLFDLEGGNIL
ncbi:MAG: hypothetical protein K0R49_1834, partial [Burkholderiales bacterium]|nr:hypothetical protein [Burkholderiales bacterium]